MEIPGPGRHLSVGAGCSSSSAARGATPGGVSRAAAQQGLTESWKISRNGALPRILEQRHKYFPSDKLKTLLCQCLSFLYMT